MAARSLGELAVPVAGGKMATSVLFSCAALPEDAQELLTLLHHEQPPLRLWIEFASAYWAAGKREHCMRVLEDGVHPDVEDVYAEDAYGRLSLFCAHATFLLRLAQTDTLRRETHFANASLAISKATKIDPKAQLPHVARGWYHMLRGHWAEAGKEFTAGLSKLDDGHRNLAPILGKAALAYQQGQYADALRLYEKVLQQLPGAPAEVRLGVGACQLRLGDVQRARAAYARALELQPGDPDALVGQALCDLHDVAAGRGGAERLSTALRALCASCAADPYNASALVLLADASARRSDARAALDLATAAYNCSTSPALRAAAAVLVARAHQLAGAVADAEKWYKVATAAVPGHAGASMGLGQLLLRRGAYDGAAEHFERVAGGAAPPPPTTAIASAAVLAVTNREELALRVLTAATTSGAGTGTNGTSAEASALEKLKDADALALLGELLERRSPDSAAAAYGRAVEAHHASGDVPPPALLNNLGALLAHRGDAAAARARYHEALKGAGASWMTDFVAAATSARGDVSSQPPLEGDAATIAFNLLCLEQEAGPRSTAATLAALLSRSPQGAADVQLRAASRALARGNLRAAEAAARAAAEVVSGDAAGAAASEAHAILGSIQLQRREWEAARKVFDELRGDGGEPQTGERRRGDDFSMVGLGACAFFTARKYTAAAGNAPRVLETEDSHLQRAIGMFGRALQRSPSNLHAAAGVAAVLAERGYLAEARDAFAAVAAASGDSTASPPSTRAEALVNLANCHFGQSSFASAVKLFTQALRAAAGVDAGIHTQLARVYHSWRAPDGSAEDNSHPGAAMRHALHALHAEPNDRALRFNAAFALQSNALHCHKRLELAVRSGSRSLVGGESAEALVTSAVGGLELASLMFAQLQHMGAFAAAGMDQGRLAVHINYCKEQAEKVRKWGPQAELLDARVAKLQSDLERSSQLKALERKQREEQEAAEREREQQMRDQAFARSVERAKAASERLAKENDANKKGDKGKEEPEYEQDEDAMGGDDADGGENLLEALFGKDDEDEGGPGGPGADGDADELEGKTDAAPKRKRLAERAVDDAMPQQEGPHDSEDELPTAAPAKKTKVVIQDDDD